MFDRILVDIDTQHDFMLPDGALYVPGAEQTVPNLIRLFTFARERKVPVLSSADCHAPDDPEFAQWPPHCIVGTTGQAKLPETLLPKRTLMQPTETIDRPETLYDTHDQVVFNKVTIDVWTNANAARLVERLKVGEYIVFGVATDYCVRTAVRGLRQRGRRVAVVVDAICAVAEETGKAAIDEMKAAGVQFVTTDQVVGATR